MFFVMFQYIDESGCKYDRRIRTCKTEAGAIKVASKRGKGAFVIDTKRLTVFVA